MDFNFENKDLLLQAASEGQLVLFLGAGINAGCKMGVLSLEAPMGGKLAEELSEEYFPGEKPTSNLKSISQKIINLKGEPLLRDSLYLRLHPVIPSKSIQIIPQIPWAAIYTVNIDSAIEKVYEDCIFKTKQLVPIIQPDDSSPQDLLSQVGYYKLHGCILKPDSKLIFSHRDYTRSREKYLRLFSKLTVSLCDYPFLFIGFSFEDSDIHEVLQNVNEYTGKTRRHHATFVVSRNAQPSDIESKKAEGIDIISGSTEEFLPWLKANLLTKPLTIDERVEESGRPVRGWVKRQFNKDIDPELAKKIRDNCTIVSEIPTPYYDIKESRLFYGFNPTWDDILLGVPIPRELNSTIRNDLEEWIEKGKHNTNIILGPAGYGKTTLMMQLAVEFSKREGIIVLWQKQNTILDHISVINLCNNIDVPIVLFIDNASKYMQSIRSLSLDAESLRLPIYIVAGSRGAEWNDVRGSNAIETPNPWHLPRLTMAESRLISKTLLKTRYLAAPYNEASEDDLTLHFYEESNQHLLAGLKVAVTGSESKFDDIIADEFYKIRDDLVRNLYKKISLIQSVGLGTPLPLASYFSDVPLLEFHSRFRAILDEVILEEADDASKDILLFTQHRVIAESIIKNVVQSNDLVELLLNIAKSIDYHDSSQSPILKRLYNNEYLSNVMGHTGRTRSTYNELMKEFPSEPYIRQHAAIFESHAGEFDKARELIEEAINLKGRHPHFLNTKGTIWLRDALNEIDPDRAEYALKKGVELIRERIKKDSDKEIHYHSLIDKLIRWAAKDHLSEKQRIRVLEEAQNDLDKALTYYPTSSDLTTLAGKLYIELRNIPSAEDNLKRSITLDSGNSWARVLLANLLLDKGEIEQAIKIVDESLLSNPGVCSLLRLRIICLEKLDADWSEMRQALLDYLKIAAKDFHQRLKLIRGLVLNRRYNDARKHIDVIKETYYLPFDIKLNRVVELGTKETPFVVEGVFRQRRLFNGFLKIDGFPSDLDAFLDFRRIEGKTVASDGQRIKAEIALNGFGLFVKRVV